MMKRENIVLVGMPCCGKTTVGRYLAERCALTFIDLDEVILKKKGYSSVSEIFELEDGELKFRDFETEVLEQVAADAKHIVIATGGGCCMRAHNRKLMQGIGTVVWLDASLDIIITRLRDDRTADRPLLQYSSEAELKRTLRDMINKRKSQYSSCSEYHLNVDELTSEKVAQKLITELDLTVHESLFDTVLAIDGPVASGKSSVAREVAKELDWVHVNTGAMYRCVALLAGELNQQNVKAEELTQIATSLDFAFGPSDENGVRRVLLRGEDVTRKINTQEVSKKVSKVADTMGVRAALADMQRQMAIKGCAVLEGRDISTVVCPEARWKVFLVASLEERAHRRESEYIACGDSVDPIQLYMDIQNRDTADRLRPQGGLKLHPDAVIFDTTDVPMNEVVTTIANLTRRGVSN